MSKYANAGADPGVAQASSGKNEPAYTSTDSGFQDLVIRPGINNNGCRCRVGDYATVPNVTDLLGAALGYAAAGLLVFPCKPRTKDPAFKGSFYNATTNPETIKRWWSGGYPYNIAMRTGGGIFVLDADPRHDGDISLRRLEAEHGPLPETREVLTVQGGCHRYFKSTAEIRNSAGKIAPGIDVRGEGGYVMLPPSVWQNGRAYTWSVDSTDTMAEAPQWLIELACKKPSISERALAAMARPSNGRTPGAYGAAAPEYEIEILANTPPGSRNHQLNRSSFSLYQLVGGGELDGAEVERRLIEACNHNGLIKDDGLRSVLATIASGRRAGLQHPRGAA